MIESLFATKVAAVVCRIKESMSITLPKSPHGSVASAPRASLISQLRWLWMPLVCILIIFGILMAVELTRSTIRSRQRARWHSVKEAVSNLRQLGLALFEFDNAYGRFPDNSTIQKIKDNAPESGVLLGKSFSNDYFRQLMATEIVTSEFMFHARSRYSLRPDNIVKGGRALEKGECAFAYIPGLSCSEDRPETPVVMFPLVPGKLLFDYELCEKYYEGMAFILFIDNSVKIVPVDKSGHVYPENRC